MKTKELRIRLTEIELAKLRFWYNQTFAGLPIEPPETNWKNRAIVKMIAYTTDTNKKDGEK